MQILKYSPIRPDARANPLETAAVLFIVVVIVATLYVGVEILQPLALAGLLSFVLSPVIRTLTRSGLGKTLSVLIAVVSAVGMIVLLSLAMAQQVRNLANDLPTYETNLREKIRTIKSFTVASAALDKAGDTLKELKTELEKGNPPASQGPTLVTPQKPIPVQVLTPDPALFEQYTSLVSPLIKPVAQTGLVILFLLFILLQREDLRDRVLKLAGTRDLQRSTVAMTDAGKSLSKYFLLQLVLNAGFGLVIAIGLAVIGVPNSLLWGMLAGLMRFVPFIGSLIAAVFPVLLAASVDPGWTMVFATIALFLIMEPLAGQVVEPLVYGKNTGLSPLAIIVATIFWTLIWGPIGLLLATPLTLCLVVLGNHVPGLSMLTVLLGDQPALTPSERLYQRLLVGDVAESESLAEEEIEQVGLLGFYQDVAIPSLGLAQSDAKDGTVPVEYLSRVSASMEELADDLDDHDLTVGDKPVSQDATPLHATCLGARGWVDEAGAHVLAHVLRKSGINAAVLPGKMSAEGNRHLIIDADTGPLFCVSTFGDISARPLLRYVVRRIRRQCPNAKIMACCWDLDSDSMQDEVASTGVDAVIRKLSDAPSQVRSLARGSSIVPVSVGDDLSIANEPELAKASAL